MKLPGDMAAFFVTCATSSTVSGSGPGNGATESDMAENAALQALEWAEDPNIALSSPPLAEGGVEELLRAAASRARQSLHAGPDTMEFLQQSAALLRKAQDSAPHVT